MQEQVNDKAVSLSVQTAKFTGKKFEQLILHLLNSMKKQKNSRDSPVVHKGKQTVKQLIGQNAGIANIEIGSESIRKFEKIARKYGVDFSITKDASAKPPKFSVFFKPRDKDALMSAFTEYNNKVIQKPKKPSLISQLKKNLELVKNKVVDRVKNKDKGLER